MSKEHFKKKYSLLQSDSSEEDELETDLVSISLDNCQIIQIHYSQLCKHSKLIRNKYLISDVRTHLSKDIQKYQHENKIDPNNLISFFKLLQDEEIEMTNDKYFDFYKLSEFFQIKKLSKNLDKYYQQNASNIDFIIQFLLNEKNSENSQFKFTTQMENILVNHIDEFIKNENTKRLHVSTIYRILKKCNKTQIPNGELFDLIMKSIPNFFVLFEFIDLQQLSDHQFEDLLKSYTHSNFEYEKFFQHLPCNLVFLNELRNKVSRLEAEKQEIQDKLNKSEQTNENLNKKSDNVQLQFNYLISQYQNKLNEIEQSNERMKSELVNSNQKSDSLQIQINELTNENNQLKTQINECQNQINYFKNECEKLQKQCKELESLKNEEEKEEDLFDPFASPPRNFSSFNVPNGATNATKDSNNLFPSFQNEFTTSNQAQNTNLYNDLQDPFASFSIKSNNNDNNSGNNNNDQGNLVDPFGNPERTKNTNFSEPLQNPFGAFELPNNANQVSFTKNCNNFSEPLEDPFPTPADEEEEEEEGNEKNTGFGFYTNINSNNTDPFGTPKEDKDDDDLFDTFKNHFSITSDNVGNQFSSPNLQMNSQHNSFSFFGVNSNNNNSNNNGPFVSLQLTQNSNNSEPLQDPFPSTNEVKDNGNFGSLQNQFIANNPNNQFQFQFNQFNGGKY